MWHQWSHRPDQQEPLNPLAAITPRLMGPGDAFHVLQWRDITEATSTLSCPSSNNASKHQINPPPLYPYLSRWKMEGKSKCPLPPALQICIFFQLSRLQKVTTASSHRFNDPVKKLEVANWAWWKLAYYSLYCNRYWYFRLLLVIAEML